ncbi:MFS transporter [Saccharopolyspora sp. CA-218241]|uniref:MFS transporter n=1 Tax=Saccharopolyspora sp. CA-218241 TaxID=3240027 RepID=UPI003D965EDA
MNDATCPLPPALGGLERTTPIPEDARTEPIPAVETTIPIHGDTETTAPLHGDTETTAPVEAATEEITAVTPLVDPAASATTALIPMVREPSPPRWRMLWWVAAILLTALNLRASIASAGSVLPELRSALHLRTVVVAGVTALPAVCFAGAALAGPGLQRRWGASATITGGLGMLAGSLGVRAFGGGGLLLVGTAAACCSLALLNVVLPAAVKQQSPEHAGTLTLAYAATISVGAGLAGWSTPVLSTAAGLRTGVALWSVPAVVALLAWLPFLRFGSPRRAAAPAPGRSLVRSARAWQITVFFGLQSLFAVTLLSWQPVLFRDRAGMTAIEAGELTALSMGASIVVSLIATLRAGRRDSYAPWLVATTLGGGLGLLGLLIAPAALPVLWALLLGAGMAALSLALALIPESTTSTGETTRLSAMAQGGGYALTAAGLAAITLAHDFTADTRAPLLLLCAACAVQLVAAVLAGRPGTVR